MKIIGLTGGIASGKNFVASIFEKNGAAIFDADKEVHDLFANNKSVFNQVAQSFPQAIIDGKISRLELGKIVFKDHKKLEFLENIIHPIIRKHYKTFLAQAKKDGHKIVILNIPLLLEKEGYDCDIVISLSIPPSIQKRRFFKRLRQNHKGISLQEMEKKFAQIKSRQLTNKERKAKSDFVIYTRFSKENTIKQVKKILQQL